ncbi:MAG: hypothetical protein IT440_10350 [Phycisphaeraceae bacterium]|nr:hypothetical protein [Phycisphaeraceae bacterium]
MLRIPTRWPFMAAIVLVLVPGGCYAPPIQAPCVAPTYSYLRDAKPRDEHPVRIRLAEAPTNVVMSAAH